MKPPIAVLLGFIALPLMSEFAYGPAIPSISDFFDVSNNIAQYATSLYLFCFALGSLTAGAISDHIGRRPTLLSGYFIYLCGSITCLYASNFTYFMLGRGIQGLGASTSSVMGQSMVQDCFRAREKDKISAEIAIAVTTSFLFGPIVGGYVIERFSWKAVFIFIVAIISTMLLLIAIFIPETHKKEQDHVVPNISKILLTMTRKKGVIAMIFIVGICNGMEYCYLAEGSFYFIDILDVDPGMYGLSFIGTALGWGAGGIISRKMIKKDIGAPSIVNIGSHLMLVGSSTMLLGVLLGLVSVKNPMVSYIIIMLSMMVNNCGMSMCIPMCLSTSIREFRGSFGTSAGIFGSLYYTVNSLVTFTMGTIRNGSLWSMPLYFCAISLLIFFVFRKTAMEYMKSQIDL